MKGYKALDQTMRAIDGNGMQFEMGETYSVEGEVVLCENGFHFCERIEDLNRYNNIKDSRIFEVETGGKIKSDGMQYVAQKIRLVREITKQEINDYFKKNWESLIKSEDDDVKRAVARQGYGLDTLVHDRSYDVRLAVAEYGYGLDILVHDRDDDVRVARTGIWPGYPDT